MAYPEITSKQEKEIQSFRYSSNGYVKKYIIAWGQRHCEPNNHRLLIIFMTQTIVSVHIFHNTSSTINCVTRQKEIPPSVASCHTLHNLLRLTLNWPETPGKHDLPHVMCASVYCLSHTKAVNNLRFFISFKMLFTFLIGYIYNGKPVGGSYKPFSITCQQD